MGEERRVEVSNAKLLSQKNRPNHYPVQSCEQGESQSGDNIPFVGVPLSLVFDAAHSLSLLVVCGNQSETSPLAENVVESPRLTETLRKNLRHEGFMGRFSCESHQDREDRNHSFSEP